ncbi:MAG: NUDIX hydrolase [Verrucomicrobia bacterium]|nr:MAG: NUDIX hydrolase [Verrucomicrobiota bacterium]
METLFATRWLAMHRIDTWDFVRRPHSELCVGILAVSANEEIILVEQFRVPLQRRVIELPAGLVGDEPEFHGEPLAETARRELLEETGYRAGLIEPLLASPTSAGMTSEVMHLFHATDLVREHAGGGVGSENITVHHIPLAELRDWLQTCERDGLAIDFKIHAALWQAKIFI